MFGPIGLLREKEWSNNRHESTGANKSPRTNSKTPSTKFEHIKYSAALASRPKYYNSVESIRETERLDVRESERLNTRDEVSNDANLREVMRELKKISIINVIVPRNDGPVTIR